jgi:hypothetical protein
MGRKLATTNRTTLLAMPVENKVYHTWNMHQGVIHHQHISGLDQPIRLSSPLATKLRFWGLNLVYEVLQALAGPCSRQLTQGVQPCSHMHSALSGPPVSDEGRTIVASRDHAYICCCHLNLCCLDHLGF